MKKKQQWLDRRENETNAHGAVAIGIKGVEDEVRKRRRVLLRERLGELLAAHLLLGRARDLLERRHRVLVRLLVHCVQVASK